MLCRGAADRSQRRRHGVGLINFPERGREAVGGQWGHRGARGRHAADDLRFTNGTLRELGLERRALRIELGPIRRPHRLEGRPRLLEFFGRPLAVTFEREPLFFEASLFGVAAFARLLAFVGERLFELLPGTGRGFEG